MINMFKKNNSGQISMEFIITILFIIGIFVFSLFLFQNRTFLNYNYSYQWDSREIATRFARNVNNVYLMDDGARVVDHFFWSGVDRNFDFGENTIRVYYSKDNYIDAPILALFESNISDLNGEILFKKIGSKVLIDYD